VTLIRNIWAPRRWSE